MCRFCRCLPPQAQLQPSTWNSPLSRPKLAYEHINVCFQQNPTSEGPLQWANQSWPHTLNTCKLADSRIPLGNIRMHWEWRIILQLIAKWHLFAMEPVNLQVLLSWSYRSPHPSPCAQRRHWKAMSPLESKTGLSWFCSLGRQLSTEKNWKKNFLSLPWYSIFNWLFCPSSK